MMSVPSLGASSLFESKGLSSGKPPALGNSRPVTGSKERTSFGVKQEWSGASSPSVWDIKGNSLELVPLDFPLERTHREINDDASKVANRISDALRALSIETEYYCKEAKAKCKTNDCVSFRIRLYAGSESGEPVIVEVQRRCGSASSFMRSCRAILDAAEGQDVTTAPFIATKTPPFMQKPIGEMKCLEGVAPIDVTAAAHGGLDHVMDMLRSNQRESNVLGLENLCCLTDPLKTSPAVATKVSKCIVVGHDTHDVREEMRELTERDVFVSEDDVELSRHADHLRHLALIVFANALTLCSKDGSLADAMKTQKWFSEYLIPSLMNELKRVESSSNNAYQAACCMQSLLSCSEAARKFLLDSGVASVLEEAHAYGIRRHELLATETERCLKLVS